jgi:hypothetical protein
MCVHNTQEWFHVYINNRYQSPNIFHDVHNCINTVSFVSNIMCAAHYLEWKIMNGSVITVTLLFPLACLRIEKLKVDTSSLIYGGLKNPVTYLDW